MAELFGHALPEPPISADRSRSVGAILVGGTAS